MALTKVPYTDNVTVIGAKNLNDIQDEIIANGNNIATLSTNKVDKVTGKGLSTLDFTVADRQAISSAYVKPGAGVPKTDLSQDVQTSLDKADNSLQAALDETLTVQGAAADAKATGDAVGELKIALTTNAALVLDKSLFINGYISGDGEYVHNKENMVSTYIEAETFIDLEINTLVSVATISLSEFSSNSQSGFLNRYYVSNSNTLTKKLLDNTKYIRISIDYNGSANPLQYFNTIGLSGSCIKIKSDDQIVENIDIELNKSEFINAYISLYGVIVPQDLNMLSQFIDVRNYNIITIQTNVPVASIVVSEYSETGFINRYIYSDVLSIEHHTQNRTAYIRVAVNYNSTSNPLDYFDTIGLSITLIVTIENRFNHIGSKVLSLQEKYLDNKYSHFSFDDCIFWKDFIINSGVYTSIFDNSFISDLKDIHEATGAVFTLNCFCTSGDYHIENVPDSSTFQNEFKQCKNWLKFAFHAEAEETRYDTDSVSAITASYANFVNGITKLTGDLDFIDHVTRLGYFTGTLANVIAIRDCNCGIVGLLTADDTRSSYYLDTTQNQFIQKHSKLTDGANQMIFIKTQLRIESVSNVSTFANQFLTSSYNNFSKAVEFFTHEYYWDSAMKNKVRNLIAIMQQYRYKFDFWENVFR